MRKGIAVLIVLMFCYTIPAWNTQHATVNIAYADDEYEYDSSSLFEGDYSTLEYGSSGWRVEMLQYALEDLGYEITDEYGEFGRSTYKAVVKFQHANGLTLDGKAGEKTLTLIEKRYDEWWEEYEDSFEPQIFLNDYEYDEELYEQYYGAIDTSEIPQEIAGSAIYSAHTNVGTIVIGNARTVYRVIDGEVTDQWSVGSDTSTDDFVFDAFGDYPSPLYRWYGYIGNMFVWFEENGMNCFTRQCAEFSYSGSNMYCYSIESGVLHAYSPCGSTVITDDVLAVQTKEGYTFVQRSDGVYVVNASPYKISSIAQDYLDEHPVPIIYLGNGTLDMYLSELDTALTGKSQAELSDDFDRKYGTDLTFWGNPRHDFQLSDIDMMQGLSFREVYDFYDYGTYDDGLAYLEIYGIDCDDHYGSLYYTFSDVRVKQVVWEGINCGEDEFADICDYMVSTGAIKSEKSDAHSATAEYVYMLDDRVFYVYYSEGSIDSPGTVTIETTYA